MMKAICLRSSGGPERLVYEDVPRPYPERENILIRVHAAGVTPTEFLWDPTWKTRTGAPRPFPIIPGHEFSGVIAALGSGVLDMRIGEAVYGLTDWFENGTQAEFCVARADALAPKPQSLDHILAAVVPISALTAWQALFDHGKLVAGQHVLVHGAAGGVGSFAIQFARWRGARVTGTASARNAGLVRDLGAGEVIDYAETPFEQVVREVDLVLDTVGGTVFERSRRVLKPGGKVVTVATGGGSSEDPAMRRAFFIVEPNRPQLTEIARLIDAGHIRPVLDGVFPLTQAHQAYLRKPGRGKNVLRISG
jgi:NADPH:quinone reductase-like Zn-dependent oxidoreductase